ncbi:MAG TPA: efflux RND transporter periplasmic adaptor subunit [Holophaga sp.]|nr:efflux RND transporter periplasmic adaptor subunit [Holophaga sp.]
MNRKALIGAGVAVIVAGGGAALFMRGGKEEIKWRTAKVDRGSITARISATGTLNALIQVPVGTQVSGVVTNLMADFNSIVKKGQVIGKIDDTPWVASVNDASATVEKAKAALFNAESDYKRNKRLWEQKLLSDADLDTKELALKNARAGLESAKANLTRARLNLDYCTLKAPVDGVVVARLVDVGQTVAASFSTPNMFTIAQDLSKMKVQAAIDEADIGQVQVGQRAFFTVDSYPEKQFRGVVSQVQLNPVVNQNVVTYQVVMEVTNEPRNAPAGDPRQGGKPGEGRGGREGGEAKAGGGRGEARGEGRGPWKRGEGGAWKAGEGRRGPDGKGGKRPEAKASLVGSPATELEAATARYIVPGTLIYRGDLALFPGMTANCAIVTKERQDVLRVPSAALRFNPNAFLKDGPVQQRPGQGGPGQGQGGGGQANRQGGGKGLVARREDRVWILENGKPKMLPVKVGATDGMFTEISGEGVNEGLVVITGVEDLKKLQAGGAAPIGAPGGPGGPRR